jgi:Fe(3+) dicitrate transport protein
MQRLFIAIFLLANTAAFCQVKPDTTTHKILDEIRIQGKKDDISRLDSINGTYINFGKKNEVINLTAKDAAITEKYGRQIFAKIPGVFVYDMDGTGNQVNISTRGLDPHRGWEFNIRKDGVMTNSDMYGYPASHYNIPMEAVEKIEMVRGTGSLQYGAQFGGSINYVSKKPDSARVFAFQSINTVGSYGLLSTFNSAGGTKGKFRYYTWFNKKSIEGYRDNSDSKFDAENISLFYDPTKNVAIKAEWTRSNYIVHLAGPLTDAMFNANPRMSTRSRNYYNPVINIPSLTVDWKTGKYTQLRLTTEWLTGLRNSVLFDKLATIPDAIDPSTLQYANRQVDIDHFNSFTSELRFLHSYPLLGKYSTLVMGVQYMKNDLGRRQLGKGTTGSDFDLTLVTPGFGRDMHLKTNNVAFFAENKWTLLPNLSLNTGMRAELGATDMSGVIVNYPANEIPNHIPHHFPLFGINAQYSITGSNINLYTGWSQAYRPVIFKDIIPGSAFEVTDKDLKDAEGYNLEAGFRGKRKVLTWDVSYFQLLYKNRLGTIAQTNSAKEQIIFRTNIGNSLTKGVEIFTQADLPLWQNASFSIFTATAYMNAEYQDAVIRNGSANVNISGNAVESAPKWQSRNGITLKFKNASFSGLYSYTDKSYADALNAVTPSATGATGLVPAYSLFDFNGRIYFSSAVQLMLNVNNAFDRKYFTKRPQFYPGPGIWPSDGRTFSASIQLNL